jgi:lambda repressor-like predicted transcriptional regulator
VSGVIHPGRLRHEIPRRGWAPTDLAKEACLSQATISAALAGRPVAERSLALIAAALSHPEVLDIVDRLIMSDATTHSLG